MQSLPLMEDPTHKAIVVFPPEEPEYPPGYDKSVFLAGSIDQGNAVEWQLQMTTHLKHLPIIILNPRRPAWNSEWKQDISNPPFYEQVM